MLDLPSIKTERRNKVEFVSGERDHAIAKTKTSSRGMVLGDATNPGPRKRNVSSRQGISKYTSCYHSRLPDLKWGLQFCRRNRSATLLFSGGVLRVRNGYSVGPESWCYALLTSEMRGFVINKVSKGRRQLQCAEDMISVKLTLDLQNRERAIIAGLSHRSRDTITAHSAG